MILNISYYNENDCITLHVFCKNGFSISYAIDQDKRLVLVSRKIYICAANIHL